MYYGDIISMVLAFIVGFSVNTWLALVGVLSDGPGWDGTDGVLFARTLIPLILN